MTTLTPSSVILTNVNINTGTININPQPANDFVCEFRNPIYLKEGSQIALKSIEFESANEIEIDDTCNQFYIYINGAGLPINIGATYPGGQLVQLTNGFYTLETLLEHISNQMIATCVNVLTSNVPPYTAQQFYDHLGIRVYLNEKGYVRFQFERINNFINNPPPPPTHYEVPTTYEIWTAQRNLANILGLALNPDDRQQSVLHELNATTGEIQFIDCDYQPLLNRTTFSTSPCVLVELQNLRIRSMNSYIRGNVNVLAKVPLYNHPIQYIDYEPATPVYFKTQETTLTDIRIRLLNIDMSLHNTTNQKPTIVVLEIIPAE